MRRETRKRMRGRVPEEVRGDKVDTYEGSPPIFLVGSGQPRHYR
jgi:hypothetical protein